MHDFECHLCRNRVSERDALCRRCSKQFTRAIVRELNTAWRQYSSADVRHPAVIRDAFVRYQAAARAVKVAASRRCA